MKQYTESFSGSFIKNSETLLRDGKNASQGEDVSNPDLSEDEDMIQISKCVL